MYEVWQRRLNSVGVQLGKAEKVADFFALITAQMWVENNPPMKGWERYILQSSE